MKSQDIKEINLGNDMYIRYLKQGNGKPLILLHTIRTQLEYFDSVIPQLAEKYTVYAIDLAGHGYSSIDLTAPYDEPYFRKTVISFIKKLDLTDITLVGESIGAVLALTIASELKTRVKKVIASNPYDYDKKYGDGVRRGNFLANFVISQFALPLVGAVVAYLENIIFLSLIMKGGLKQKSWIPFKLISMFNKAGKRKGFRYVERKTFSGWRSWGEARNLYKDVKAPVSLVYGAHDWSTTGERAATAKALGVINPITLPNTGHFAFIDNPNKLLALI